MSTPLHYSECPIGVGVKNNDVLVAQVAPSDSALHITLTATLVSPLQCLSLLRDDSMQLV